MNRGPIRSRELGHAEGLLGYFAGVRDFFPQESFHETHMPTFVSVGTGLSHGSCTGDWAVDLPATNTREPQGNKHLTVLLPTGARCIVSRRHSGNVIETHCGWFGAVGNHLLSRSEEYTCIDCTEIQTGIDERMEKDPSLRVTHAQGYGKVTQIILRTIRESKIPIGTKGIARLNPDINPTSIPGILHTLFHRGVLRRVSCGLYTVATP